MSLEKYQIKQKSHYLKLLILKDDLEYFHELLSNSVKSSEDWLAKLRNTRQVFIALDNVRELAQRMNLRGQTAYIDQTRSICKLLAFVNHFRNKAIGHLDNTLFERAVQWAPSLFSAEIKKETQIIEGHRAVIEATINSYVDAEGIQNVFKTEIDLMYPPNNQIFYEYLWKVVTESIAWINESLNLLSAEIKYNSRQEMHELSAVAGQTEFNLKSESDLTYDEDETRMAFEKALEKLKEMGTKKQIIDFIEDMKSKSLI